MPTHFKNLKRYCLIIAIFFLGLSSAESWEEGKIGMDAPELTISKWLKGEKVVLAEGKGKNIYIVEFWATWCPPCRDSIPHLSELQKKFKDKNVVFIGVTSEDDSLGTVSDFVKQQGDNMNYTVAVDQENATFQAYMQAFNKDGIPWAFLVDKDGKIAWNGLPDPTSHEMEEVIQKVLDGTFDAAAFAQKQQTRKTVETLVQCYLNMNMNGVDKKYMTSVTEGILELGNTHPGALLQLAEYISQDPRIKDKDMELATKAVNLALEKVGKEDPLALAVLGSVTAALGKKDEAVKLYESAIEFSKNNAELSEQLKQQLDDLKNSSTLEIKPE